MKMWGLDDLKHACGEAERAGRAVLKSIEFLEATGLLG